MTITREEWDELRSEVAQIQAGVAALLELVMEQVTEDQADSRVLPGFERYRAKQKERANA